MLKALYYFDSYTDLFYLSLYKLFKTCHNNINNLQIIGGAANDWI